MQTIPLDRIISELFRRLPLILISGLIAGMLALFVSACFVAPEYKASAILLVSNYAYDTERNAVSADDLAASQTLAKTYALLLESRSVLQEVLAEVPDAVIGMDALLDMTEITLTEGTALLTVSVTAENAETCVLLANAFAKASRSLPSLTGIGSVDIVENAQMPDAPISPNHFKNTALGAVFGMALCTMATLLLFSKRKTHLFETR